MLEQIPYLKLPRRLPTVFRVVQFWCTRRYRAGTAGTDRAAGLIRQKASPTAKKYIECRHGGIYLDSSTLHSQPGSTHSHLSGGASPARTR
jgi:hypothetical protein